MSFGFWAETWLRFHFFGHWPVQARVNRCSIASIVGVGKDVNLLFVACSTNVLELFKDFLRTSLRIALSLGVGLFLLIPR